MTDAAAFALFREGALYGLLGGVLVTIACQEVVHGFREWRRSLQRARLLSQLRTRCAMDDECVLGAGHRGTCELQPYE